MCSRVNSEPCVTGSIGNPELNAFFRKDRESA